MYLLKSCCESSHENTEDRNWSLACTSSIGLYKELLVTSPSATVSTQWVILLKNSSIMFNSRLAHAVTQWGPWSPETNCWNELNSLGSSWIDITTDLEKPKKSIESCFPQADEHTVPLLNNNYVCVMESLSFCTHEVFFIKIITRNLEHRP